MIKFPFKDDAGMDKTYLKDVDSLSADHSANSFCSNFSDVFAIDFDSVSKDFSSWTGRTIPSVDAVLDQRKNPAIKEKLRRIYFVEFKNRRLSDLNRQGTPAAATEALRKDVVIGDELKLKGLGSVLLAGATLFKQECLDDVAFQSEYIVVYNDKRHVATETPHVKEFDDDMSVLAGSEPDRYGVPILWELNKFKGRGLFRHVHTWSIDEFNRLAPDFVK